MSMKHSHEHAASSSQKTSHKYHNQTASPETELLETKKKSYQSHYNTKNPKSTSNHKQSQSYVSSIFRHVSRPSKSPSNEKKKTSVSMSEKRKRNKTEQEKFEKKSMFDQNRNNKISKSVYDDYQKVIDNDPVRYIEQSAINKRKKNLTENQRFYSQNLHHRFGDEFEKLSIKDVDGLISLIDACVREANDYITYLSDKLSLLKNELTNVQVDRIELKKQIDVGVQALKKNKFELEEKNKVVKHLERELGMMEKEMGKKKNCFEIKSLIETIERISEENVRLRKENNELKSTFEEISHQQNMNQEEMSDYFYNMHRNIETLNVDLHENPRLKKGSHIPSHQNRKVKENGKIAKQFFSHIEH